MATVALYGVSGQAIEGLYRIICRDPGDGTGGLTPVDARHHRGWFRQWDQGEAMLEVETPNAGMDRSVFLQYTGHSEPGDIQPAAGGDHHIFSVEVQTGYWVAGHARHSQAVMADDFHLLAYEASNPANRPAFDNSELGVGGWIMAYQVEQGSAVVKLTKDFWVNRFTVRVQVRGSR